MGWRFWRSKTSCYLTHEHESPCSTLGFQNNELWLVKEVLKAFSIERKRYFFSEEGTFEYAKIQSKKYSIPGNLI